MKAFFQSHNHLSFLALLLLYVICFILVEKLVPADADYFVCYIPFLDDAIPFCEWFIIPYILWYPYMAAVGLYLGLQKEGMEFIRAVLFIVGSLLLCLLFCALFPNGQNLRLESFPRDNFLTAIIAGIYSADTNTNVLPSMHVLASLATHSVVINSKFSLFRKRYIRVISLILCLLICISTVFVKQHSALDGIVSVLVFIPLCYLAYHPLTKFLEKKCST